MALIKTCEACNQEFTVHRDRHGHVNKKKRFCTQSCWVTHYNRTDSEHSVKGATAAGATNIVKLRGTGSRTYVKEYARHQHRVVAERVLGRELTSGEVVHHEDENKKNNDPSNLIVFKSNGDHIRHHHACLNKQQTCQCDCIRLKEVMPK